MDECAVDNGLCQQICINQVGVTCHLSRVGVRSRVSCPRLAGRSAAVCRATDSPQTAGAAQTLTSARSRTFVEPGPGTASTPGARTRVTVTRATRTAARHVWTQTSAGTIPADTGSASTLQAGTSASVSPDTLLTAPNVLTLTSVSSETLASMESALIARGDTVVSVTKGIMRPRASVWI